MSEDDKKQEVVGCKTDGEDGWKERLEIAQSMLKVVIDSAKLVFAVGFLLLFAYCFFEGFIQAGIAIGDVFLFAYIAFSFSVIYSVGLVYGALSSVWLIHLIAWASNRKEKKVGVTVLHSAIRDKWLPYFSFFVFLLVIVPVSIAGMNSPDVESDLHPWIIFGTLWACGFFILALFAVSHAGKVADKDSVSLKIRIAVAVAIGLLIAAHPPLLNLTMEQIGIRSKVSDIVTVDEISYKKVISVAKLKRVSLKSCQLDGQSLWVIKDLKVVWNGFGEKSFIEFANLDRKTNKWGADNITQLSVAKGGIDIVRGASRPLTCNWMNVS